MKKCPVCGVEHADTSKICSICGSPLSGDAGKPAAPAPEQAPPAAPAPEQAAPAAPDFASDDIQAAVSSIVSQAVNDAAKETPRKPEHAPAQEAPKPVDDDPFDDDSPFVVNAMRSRREKTDAPAQPAQPKAAGRSPRKPAPRPRPARPAAARGGADEPAASPKPTAASESAARPVTRPAADRHQPPAGSDRIDTTAVAAASAQKVQQARQNAMAAKARTAPPASPEAPGEEDFNWSERKHPRRTAKSSTPVIAAVCALLALIIIAMIVLIGRLVSGDGAPVGDTDMPDSSASETNGDETGDGTTDGDAVTPDDGTTPDDTGDAEAPDDGTTPDGADDAETPDDGTVPDDTGDAETPDDGTTPDGAGDAESPDGGAADGGTGDAGTPDDGAADGDASSEGGSTEQPALPEITEVSDTVYATASLRVRDYPGTSGAVINSLTAGQAVNRTGRCSNGWSRVEIGGVTGYVSERYLSATAPDTSSDGGSGSDGGSTSLDGITITEVNETVYTTAGVNVRNYPGSSGSVIATIAEGQSVTRTGRCSNGWSRVSVNGATGYIYSSYLSGAQSGSGSDSGSASLDGITVTEANETVYATTGVNVRDYPGSSGSVINVLTRGQSVTRTGRCSNGWSRVSVGGVTGYVYSGYLSTSQSGGGSGSGSGSGGTSSSYLLPDSDSRYYSRSELSSLSSSELRLARNEIYARNGRRFNDSSLQEYFNGKSWYSGTVDADTFDANINQYLNSYELANLLLIIELENG